MQSVELMLLTWWKVFWLVYFISGFAWSHGLDEVECCCYFSSHFPSASAISTHPSWLLLFSIGSMFLGTYAVIPWDSSFLYGLVVDQEIAEVQIFVFQNNFVKAKSFSSQAWSGISSFIISSFIEFSTLEIFRHILSAGLYFATAVISQNLLLHERIWIAVKPVHIKLAAPSNSAKSKKFFSIIEISDGSDALSLYILKHIEHICQTDIYVLHLKLYIQCISFSEADPSKHQWLIHDFPQVHTIDRT